MGVIDTHSSTDLTSTCELELAWEKFHPLHFYEGKTALIRGRRDGCIHGRHALNGQISDERVGAGRPFRTQ
jgi:hypothetical protein